MNAAIIQNEHQQLIRKTRMQLMQEGNKGSGITPGSLFPIHPLTLKIVSFRQACLISLYGSVKSAFLIPTPDSGFPFR
jgi:hypothetical protein